MEVKASLISTVNNEKKIEILRKNWMSHEGRYQMAIVREFGWEKANNINKNVIYEMGKVMMYRLMNALGISQVDNIDDFKEICMTATEFYYPPPVFSIRLDRESDTSLLGSVEKCGTIKNVKRLGVLDQYECGCLAMRSGWYKALGVEVKEELLQCLKDGADTCKIKLIVKGWNK
ncbi:MAG: L-2-amino-thiazoline-4-carboxylic acid hydrolase [Promethearchaeota archaeon]|nr:MAG: L-2-amino-thiazoline-4-carboxylic acid hydrolase [Candidatus Lokiarchaeota archaeon]